jgi:hypothetical protein
VSRALVAHTCNPSYLGNWDQEDHVLRPTQGKYLQDPISKTTPAKWTGGLRGRAPALRQLLCKQEALSSNPRHTHTHTHTIWWGEGKSTTWWIHTAN